MPAGNLTRLDRFVNTVLLVLLTLLGISGVVMLYGTWLPWLFDLHRMAGFSLIILLPWKGITIYRSLSRGMDKTFDRSWVLFASWGLVHFMLILIILALIWMWRTGPYSTLTQTLIAWHWILGLLAVPWLALHAWRRWPSPTRQDFLSRRSFLQLLGVAGAGIVLGDLANLLAQGQATEASPRRLTGSRGFGLFAGNDFPIFGEATILVDSGTWRLAVDGAVASPLRLTYQQLLAMPQQAKEATIDCTSGWYSVQNWGGVPLVDLLAQAGAGEGIAGVRLFSATGYHHTYPIAEARTILLATHVTGEVLAPRHGFPLRAVVPDRRGWFWVKWLTRIEVLDSAWQVAAGILNSPLQVLRQWP
jgi:DMSO/TMAO reductase YedYZ molybdopterin-dependent catalytic subunit